MKMYETPAGALNESVIDPGYRDAGLADGSITERDATHAEELAECYRLRQIAYDLQLPISDQLDADWHARRGDPSKQQALDAAKDAIKLQYPKPQ